MQKMVKLQTPMEAQRRSHAPQAATRDDQVSEFCTVAEAAALLGVSVSTVWRWVDSGKLAAFRVGPKSIRIRRTDAEAAVQPVSPRIRPAHMNTFVDIESASRPLTREESERGRSALAAADKLREGMLKRRKGKPLSDSAAIIADARRDRSRQI
jgi:excisionase family DNA binding protein